MVLLPLSVWAAGPPPRSTCPAGCVNHGTRNHPLPTIQCAQRAVGPGGRRRRGRTYQVAESRVAAARRLLAWITVLDRSGAPGRPITYRAYPGERPVFDCSAVNPTGKRVTAFYVRGSWPRLEGCGRPPSWGTVVTLGQSRTGGTWAARRDGRTGRQSGSKPRPTGARRPSISRPGEGGCPTAGYGPGRKVAANTRGRAGHARDQADHRRGWSPGAGGLGANGCTLRVRPAEHRPDVPRALAAGERQADGGRLRRPERPHGAGGERRVACRHRG